MTSSVKMILDEVNARIKLAEAKTAEDPSNFDSFPGAENDQKVKEDLKKPDPEVKDEGPASRTEVDGAEPGSDAKVEQDHLYEADEPVLTPEKKPADTAEADAKTASANPEVAKVASDILGIIKNNLKSTKKAENHTMSLKDSILDKIASVRMAKQAGANDAMNLIKAAADYQRGAQDAQAMIMKLAQDAQAEQAAAAEPTPEAAPAAEAPAGGDEDPVTPEEVAQAVGELVQEGQISQEDAAAVINQMGADEGGNGQVDGEVTDDDIAEGIAQAIESGEITEDEAQQLVQELVSDGADESVEQQVADAGADAGAEQTPEAAGAADAEAAIADAAAQDAAAQEAQKAASATLTPAEKVASIVSRNVRARSMNEKIASHLTKSAEDEQIARYQNGFIQKCAEYGCDPQRVAQYLQARIAGAR